MDKPLAKKVMVVGWDSADWKIINPLLDSGAMPNLDRFVNEGAIGKIATLSPSLSPILWNSIATGKLPEKHGIFGFVEPMPDGSGIRPVSSTSRKAKAIWNILTQNQLKTHVVGWFASHPAEPINGVCVSNHFYMPTIGTEGGWPVFPQSLHPANMAEKLASLRVHTQEIEGAHLQPFIPLGAKIDQNSKAERKRLYSLQKNLAECASVHSITTWLMENEPWDFMAVYYNAIDIISHYFMPFHPPKMEGIDDREFEIYKDVVTGIYRFHDMMLGRLMELAGPDTTIILLSDHGFHSDHLRPAAGSNLHSDPTAWHRSHGIIALRGPGIIKDQRIYGASLVDVVPTVLTILGLPVGNDMDGKALVEAFETPPEVKAIPSWETVEGNAGMHPPDLRQDPVAAQQALQQLADLGYVEAPNGDAQKSVQNAVSNLQFNRAFSLLEYGDPLEAAKIFKDYIERNPEDRKVGYYLARAYFTGGKLAEARAVLEGFLAKDANVAPMELMMGSLLLAEGNHEAALQRLLNAEKLAPELPQLHTRLGNAYLRCRRWKDGERAFRKALEIDGDHAEACHGMSVALLRQGQFEPAADFSLRAIGLKHVFPAAHFQLGMALARLNRPERAAMAFEHGLAMRPGLLVAHRYLARLYYRMGNGKKCHEHRDAIAQIKRHLAATSAAEKSTPRPAVT